MKRWLTRRWFMMFAGGASPALLGAASRASSAGEVHTVSARGITVRLSADGDILGAVCDGHECHLTGGTRLDGCERVGEARATVRGDGAVEVRRTLRRASAGSTLVLLDRFLPHGDSVRWEIEITSDDAPWTTAIQTALQYPASAATRFWTAWSDPEHASDTWRDPRVLMPLTSTNWSYSNLSSETPERGDFISLPLFTVAEPADDRALSLILSPQDSILALGLSTTASGEIVFSRTDHRLGRGKTVRFVMDMVAHEADWRGGLRWMTQCYPQFFDPPNRQASAMAGCGAYSGSEDPIDVERFKAMSFRVNWKLSDDFPWMGMFLPPMSSAEAEWERACDEPAPPGKPRTTSYRRLNDYARYMKANGFYVLDYFNVTELGRNLKEVPADAARSNDSGLWKDPGAYIQLRLPDAHLRPHVKTFYGAWVSDCGDPVYQQFLLEQARRHIEQIPDSAGICIDRLDWLRLYNANADDGASWKNGHAARALVESWKGLMEWLSPLMHGAGKVIFVNPMTMRLDLMKEVDGFYSEHGESGPALDSMAWLSLRKPAITWTGMSFDKPSYELKPDPDRFFQRHLLMGVYPTAPYPFNNHALGPNAATDPHYLAYGALLDAMRGKRWVLAPRCVESRTPGVSVNLFEVSGGYSLPIVFGGAADSAQVVVRHVPSLETLRCLALHPASGPASPVEGAINNGALTLNVPLVRGCAMVLLRA